MSDKPHDRTGHDLPRPCPVCGKPRAEAYKPFCSKRCADIDLHRWLGGAYAIPAESQEIGGLGEQAPAMPGR